MKVTSVIKHPTIPKTIRIYIKGAPEVILSECKTLFNKEGKISRISEHDKRILLHDYVIEGIAKKGYKPIAMAFKDMSME